MKIQFKELGAISEATIDLDKKLTVFCGPNNTGKTYIATAIYGLLNMARTANLSAVNITKEDVGNLLAGQPITLEINPKSIYSFRQKVCENFNKEGYEIFGISKSDADKLFPNIHVAFVNDEENFINRLKNIELEYGNLSGVFNSIIRKKKGSFFVEIIPIKEINKEIYELSGDAIVRYMFSASIANILAFYPLTNSFILPVERNSIYTFSKELSLKRNILLDEIENLKSNSKIDPFAWLQRRKTRYPLPIRDGLEISDDLANFQKQESPYKEFAEEIETEILHGIVSATKEGEVVFASDKARSKKLPIHLTSSAVKTLSSLVFYLKHSAQGNDLIIIDEPELNLHPDNQIRITRIFARLINKGFRLIISTHSDYIIRELNNLIMLSSPNIEIGEIAKKYGYTELDKIKSEEVGAYLFNYTTKTKVKVKQIPITKEGFEVETIDEAINELNEKSEELFYALKSAGNE